MQPSENILSLVVLLALFTSFVKVTTALSIVRYGLGLLGIEVGVALVVASGALAIAAAPPEIKEVGGPGVFLSGDVSLSPERASKVLAPFMLKRIDPRVADALSVPKTESGELVSDVHALVPSFVVSELQAALSIGCMLLVPFVLLDLVVAHILTLFGVRQLSVQVVSLPCKLLLFVSVDGWTLVVKKLLGM
jgi:flagellar biosynthetic protein FliP